MSRHGWIKPLTGGAVARCGGPGMCAHCKGERLVYRGTPTDNGRCFYCKALRTPAAPGEPLEAHKPDCPWPPFAEAYS